MDLAAHRVQLVIVQVLMGTWLQRTLNHNGHLANMDT